MKYLQGFRTIIFNIVAIAATWLVVNYGIELSEEHQLAITTSIIALINIVLRLITKTPAFKHESNKQNKNDKKKK